MAELKPVVELGVAEAYELLATHPGSVNLPPLEAIENEDWGRDYLLSRFLEWPAPALAAAGLTLRDRDGDGWDRPSDNGNSERGTA